MYDLLEAAAGELAKVLQEALKARKMERQISAGVKVANTYDILGKTITSTVAETAEMECHMESYAKEARR